MISTTLGPNPFGFTHKFTVDHSDMTTANALHPQLLMPASGYLPAGTVVTTAGFRVTEGFASSDGTAITLTIGTAGNDDVFLDDRLLMFGTLDGSEVQNCVETPQTAACTLPIAIDTADQVIKAYFTVSGGATPLCTELTAGTVEIYLGIHNLSDLAND